MPTAGSMISVDSAIYVKDATTLVETVKLTSNRSVYDIEMSISQEGVDWNTLNVEAKWAGGFECVKNWKNVDITRSEDWFDCAAKDGDPPEVSVSVKKML